MVDGASPTWSGVGVEEWAGLKHEPRADWVPGAPGPVVVGINETMEIGRMRNIPESSLGTIGLTWFLTWVFHSCQAQV